MIHLHVWLRPPAGEPILAGEIVVADPDTARGGRVRGEFRYTRSFIETPDAFALDPRHLPLGPDSIAAGAVKNIMNEVREAVEQFPRIGDEYGVPAKEIDTLVARMRLSGPG